MRFCSENPAKAHVQIWCRVRFSHSRQVETCGLGALWSGLRGRPTAPNAPTPRCGGQNLSRKSARLLDMGPGE